MNREQNIKNLKTEKEGIKVLKSLNSNFLVPTIEERKYIYKKFKIEYSKYSRSVDGIILNVDSIDKIKSLDDFLFVEIKTTKSKSVKELPFGVFFGFTKNEEDLFESLKNYRLCIVHVILQKYYLLDHNEYLSLIQNKRIQYQINFKSKTLL